MFFVTIFSILIYNSAICTVCIFWFIVLMHVNKLNPIIKWEDLKQAPSLNLATPSYD